MSSSSQVPWSNNPYAPQITHRLYFAEKTNFAGFVIGAVCYGIVIVLFFHCMSALLGPVSRKKGGIKWELVAHTVAMFSFVTVYTAANLDFQSISYIDNRNFPGGDGVPPGPFGYQIYVYFIPISLIQSIMFALNGWLADGLLLYRCYVIYAKNHWVIAFPCLMYLASVGIGIVFLALPVGDNFGTGISFGVPYYSISLSLNVLLTLMIVARLYLHTRRVRSAMGASAVTGGLYAVVVTMLVESCALYAISYLLFIVPWALESPTGNIFFPILAETQVIAPLLITLRVAKQREPQKQAITDENTSSLHFGGRRKPMGDSGAVSYGQSTDSTSSRERSLVKGFVANQSFYDKV